MEFYNLQPLQAEDPGVAATVMAEVLAVVPNINRLWLARLTGHDSQFLINAIFDNYANIPLEPGSVPMDTSMDEGDALVALAGDDYIQRIRAAPDNKKDAVVAALIAEFKKQQQPDAQRRAGNVFNVWMRMKDFLEKKFSGVKLVRLQKTFSPLHVVTLKGSLILATLMQLGYFTEQLAGELGVPQLWKNDIRLKAHRRGRPPPPPANLAESEIAVAEIVETVLGDPAQKISCCVCFGDFFPKWMLHCGEEDTQDPHHVCVPCFREQGKALCTNGKLAEGGQGLPCMEPACERIYPWAKVKKILDAKTRKTLGRRIDQEALVVLAEDIEYCKSCSFGMIIEATTDEVRYFNCPRCEENFCRNCKADWALHGGKSCDEMNVVEDARDKARKQLEEELAAAIVRRCHRCGLQFAKEDGCNKMTCRCKATQCYICRAQDINYEHFCRHVHVPDQPGCPLNCGGCTLWEKKDKVDRAAINAVRERALADENLREVIEQVAGK